MPQGTPGAVLRSAVARTGVGEQVVISGFADDLVGALALSVLLEADGMSRILVDRLAASRSTVASRVAATAEVPAHGRDALLIPADDAPAP